LPCYQINLISVDIAAANKDLLEEAIKALGLAYTRNGESFTITTPSGRITIEDGKATFSNAACQQWVNKMKQAYSFKTIEYVAKKYKFTMTTKPGNQITLRRY
jgi:hypothetical protein